MAATKYYKIKVIFSRRTSELIRADIIEIKKERYLPNTYFYDPEYTDTEEILLYYDTKDYMEVLKVEAYLLDYYKIYLENIEEKRYIQLNSLMQ